jgi:ribonuclease VapC
MRRGHSAVLLDTSAVVAILTREEGWPDLVSRLLDAETVAIPAPCAAEALLVMQMKLSRDPMPDLLEFYRNFEIEILPFTAEHLSWFGHGFRLYGKGRNAAGLNLGDCFTYAVAKYTGLPLVFVGNGFARTDVTAA